MATLINGDGNAAVYAAQDSDWFAGVEGNTTKILKVGAKMEYEIEDANTIAIKNGVLVTKEGRRVQIDAGAIDEFIIPTGTQGVTRYFIIGYHLYTDASSNQLCETFVQLMANGTDTIPEDTFRGGSTDVYVSLYRVKQDGITLDTIQSLLPEGVDLDGIDDDITDIKADIDQINSDLTELKLTRIYPAAVSNISSINMAQCYRMGSLAIINIAISVTDPSQGASCRVDAMDGYTFKIGQSYTADCYSGWSYTEQHFISTVISGSSITFQAPNSPYVALHCVAALEKV